MREYRTPVRPHKAFQPSNLTFFVLWSSYPLPFPSYIRRGLPVRFLSPIGVHSSLFWFSEMLRAHHLLQIRSGHQPHHLRPNSCR